MAGDREFCSEVYEEVRGSLEAGLAYLMDKREEDPYKDFARRMAYEFGGRGARQAPTFEP